jgi:hypothetical protein
MPMAESASAAPPRARADGDDLTRREFTLEAALALLAGVTITVSGCGEDSPMAPGGGSGGGGNPNDIVGVIGTNHGHTVRITEAQLDAGVAVTLTLTVGEGHTHTVALSMADLTALNNNQVVQKVSSFDATHDHTVSFTP